MKSEHCQTDGRATCAKDHQQAQTETRRGVNRREFLQGGVGVVGGLAVAGPLAALMTRKAQGIAYGDSPYGPPIPIPDQNTGIELLQLPEGFEYWSFGWTGDPLDDGSPTPALHDGMGTLPLRGLPDAGEPLVILCRNHEVNRGPAFTKGKIQYSPAGGGGNTNLIWNTETRILENAYPSLAGTVRNCAGGTTIYGTWLSCEEETNSDPDDAGFLHGYVFEVNARGDAPAIPIIPMGRFTHEAVAQDRRTGFVYLTEDRGENSGFYRYRPLALSSLLIGGHLEMLKVVGRDEADLRFEPAGSEFDVEWVPIPNPDAPTTDSSDPESVHGQGRARGGAHFQRLEGCWYGLGSIFFIATDGGPVFEGQVFEFDPVTQRLKVIYASPGQDRMENPDNLVVTPRGGLLLCEDNSGETTNPAERMLGLTLDGQIFTFAINNLDFTKNGHGSYTRKESGRKFNEDWRQMEWAGATYSEDGQWLFVNIQTPGLTFAIRPKNGDWGDGPL